MERPKGVTVLACIYFFVASGALITLIPSQTFHPLQRPRLLLMSVVWIIIGVTLGIALLRMKNWSRWLAIILCATGLLRAPYAVAVAHNSITLIQTGLGTLLALWVIWYLTRPHIKAAFQSA